MCMYVCVCAYVMSHYRLPFRVLDLQGNNKGTVGSVIVRAALHEPHSSSKPNCELINCHHVPLLFCLFVFFRLISTQPSLLPPPPSLP